MIPNAADVARRRWTVTTIFRVLALVLLVFSTLPLLSWLEEGLADGDFTDFSYYADRIALIIVTVAGAAVLFIFARLIARLAVPIPKRTQCPACRHRIEGVNEARCTECGLPLTQEFLTGNPEPPESDARRAARVLRRRETVATVFRFCGVVCTLMTFLSVGGTALIVGVTLLNEGMGNTYLSSQILLVCFQFFIWAGASLLLLFGARRLARFCVPFDRPLPPVVPGD